MPTDKLTDRDLVAIIQNHRRDSLGVEDGELTNERAVALDRYHGRPYGNEMEGRSAVVSKDLSEAVDWAMPAIMRVFTQSGSVAEFSPVSSEDEQQAEIETAYVNQVIMKDNDGWIVLHDAIKDTLLLKNGYVKHWWDEETKIEETEYQGLVIEEVQQLMGELKQLGAEDVEITGQEERTIETQDGQQIPVFDLKIKATRKIGKVKIAAVPCEEIRVSKRCRGNLQESPFVEHVTLMARSDLIEMGMDKEFVEGLPAYSEKNTGGQETARNSVADETNTLGQSIIDRSMDEIEYCEAYIRVDFDGDGIAELRKVVTVANEIPDGEEWNKPIPECAITGFVAKRVPHRHVGESLYDDLGDLQEIKTVLLRQMLDNIYLTNNNQWLVNERVDITDFMTSLPGGIKRIEGIEPVDGAVQAVVTPSIIGQILPVVDYMDGIKESRTGINKATTGLDPDVLKQSTKGAFMENLNRASQKVEMITRLIAETGVKELVLRVHSLLCRYQDKQRIIKMKGKYIPINPTEWRERTDLSVKVGLGTGNEEDKQRKLLMVADLQTKMLGPQGLVGPEQAFALFSEISKALGFEIPDKFSISPESPEFQQKMQNPPQDPMVQIETMKAQARAQEFQEKMQADAHHAQVTAQVEDQKAQAQLRQEQLRSENDVAIEREKINAQMELERFKAQLRAETDIAIERLRLEHAVMQQGMM